MFRMLLVWLLQRLLPKPPAPKLIYHQPLTTFEDEVFTRAWAIHRTAGIPYDQPVTVDMPLPGDGYPAGRYQVSVFGHVFGPQPPEGFVVPPTPTPPPPPDPDSPDSTAITLTGEG